jgi:CheY-like chemotaxis protein
MLSMRTVIQLLRFELYSHRSGSSALLRYLWGSTLITASRAISILLVDDDPGDVLMIEEALESIGSPREIHVAGDGEEAVAFLRRKGRYEEAPRPDVILLDLNMPRMDGRQVLAEIKADRQLRSIPVIVLTTSQAPADISSSYSLHANAYVTKPMNLDELTEVVQKIDHFFARIAALPGQRPQDC